MYEEIRNIPGNLAESESFLHYGKCGYRVIIKLHIFIIFFRVSSISSFILLITLKLAEQVRTGRESNWLPRVKLIRDLWHNILFYRLQRFYN